MSPRRRYVDVHDSDSDSHTLDDFDSRMGRTPKAKVYEKALIATQCDMQLLQEKYKALNTENKVLKREIISLKEQLEALSTSATRETTGLTMEMELVKTLAKKYTALYEPFSRIYNDPNLFVSPCPSSECLLAECRFCTTVIACCDGWLAQLYDFLPESLHAMVRDYSDFDKEFQAAAKAMCSALIDRMRKAAPMIFKLHPDIFKPAYQRETVPELTQLLKFSNESSKRSSKKPRPSKLLPILFPLCVRKRGREGYETKLFQAPEIFMFGRALLYGLSSLDTTDSKHGGPSMYGKQWGVVSLEKLPFYAIPLFALLTVFIISEDFDFSSEGLRSGRNWEDYYDLLQQQFHAAYDTNEFQNIMSMCQDIVFWGQAKGKEADRDALDSGESEINWQMQALQLSDEDDTHEPRYDLDYDILCSTAFHDDPNNFNDDDDKSPHQSHACSSHLPSTLSSQPIQSSSLLPATPQWVPKKQPKVLKPASHLATSCGDPLSILPPPATPQHPISSPSSPPRARPASKRRLKASKTVSHSATSRANILFPLPPPAMPRRSIVSTPLGIASDSDESDDPSLFETAHPKKPLISKAKWLVIIELSDKESTNRRTAQRSTDKNPIAPKKTLHAGPSTSTTLAAPAASSTDKEEERDLLPSKPAPVTAPRARKKGKSVPLPPSTTTMELATRAKGSKKAMPPPQAITSSEPQPTTIVQEVAHHSKGKGKATLPPITMTVIIKPQPTTATTKRKAKAKMTVLAPAMEAMDFEHTTTEPIPPTKRKARARTTALPPVMTAIKPESITPNPELAPPTKWKTKSRTTVQPPATASIETELTTTEVEPGPTKVPNVTLPPPGTTMTGPEATVAEPGPRSKGKGATKKQKGAGKTVTFKDADGPAGLALKRRLRSTTG